MKDYSFPLAPLNEQQRIVAEIEKQFSRLDEAVANLKRVKANLKRYKAAVLKAAVEGKLTEAWRKAHPDVEPASKLLDRILAERRAKWEEAELAKMEAKGKAPKNDKWKAKYIEPIAPDISKLARLPAGWVWASIDQLLFSLRNGLPRKPEDTAPGISILRVSAVRPLELDVKDKRFYRLRDGENVEDYNLQARDVLFVRYNGTKELVGCCAVVESEKGLLLYPDKLIRGRVVSTERILPEYLVIAARAATSTSPTCGQVNFPQSIATGRCVFTRSERALQLGPQPL